MSKKITITTLLIISVLIGVGIFYACKKEENPTTKAEVLKSSSNSIYVEELAIEAHNIIVDFILRSKDALDDSPDYFKKLCLEGNQEELMNLIGYTNAEDIEKGERLFEITKEISAIYDKKGLSQNTKPCSSCTLETLPQILLDLNYEPQGAPPHSLEDLVICLWECGIACSPLSFFPALYAACIVACTAPCYYLSTGRAIALY